MQHIAPQEKLAAMIVSNQPKDLTFEVIRDRTKEGVRDGLAKESKESTQGQEQTQRKITGPEDVWCKNFFLMSIVHVMSWHDVTDANTKAHYLCSHHLTSQGSFIASKEFWCRLEVG